MTAESPEYTEASMKFFRRRSTARSHLRKRRCNYAVLVTEKRSFLINPLLSLVQMRLSGAEL